MRGSKAPRNERGQDSTGTLLIVAHIRVQTTCFTDMWERGSDGSCFNPLAGSRALVASETRITSGNGAAMAATTAGPTKHIHPSPFPDASLAFLAWA